MKLFQADFEKSGRLSAELLGYDAKYGPQLEKDLGVCDEEIDKAKVVFDYAKLHDKGNLWELSGKLEAPQLKKIKLKQDHLNAKDAIAQELRKITTPVILGYSQELMAEFSRLETRKVFSVVTDKENIEGGRVFEVSHNFFDVHQCQQEILETISKLRSMDTESLSTIRDLYEGMISRIPEKFKMTISEGNETLKIWIFENKPREIDPVAGSIIWMHQARYLADLEDKVKNWKAGELLKKHKPIEYDMT
ncbi:MAG: hypothetical protein ABSH06_18530 [Thermodesulfobacteriota bacterium]|jgi:hypothetical protein